MRSPGSPRRGAALLAVGIALGLLGTPGPTLAASSPEAAVLELLDRAAGRDLGDLDGLVCAAHQETVRSQFDPGALLGDPSAAGGSGEPQGPAFEFSDRAVSVVSQDDDTAVVRLTATMTLDMDEAQVREYVLGLMEATDTDFSDEDIEQMVGLFTTGLATGQEVDEEIALIREGGEWVVCDDPEGSEPAIEPSVSTDGICGLISPAELDGLGPLTYDSSYGSSDFCSFSSTSFDDFHNLSLSFSAGTSLDEFRAIFAGGEDIDVAGLPAYAYADGGALFVSVDGGVLQVAPYLGEGPAVVEVDTIAYASQVAELVIPRLPELATDPEAEEPAEVDPLSEPGPSLCEALPLEEVNAISALEYDEVMGDAGSCFFTSVSEETGFHSLNMYTEVLELEILRQIFPDGTDLTTAGRPAYSDGSSLWVSLGDRLLTIVPYFFGSPVAESVDPVAYSVQVAEIIVPRLLEAEEAE
ncbi:hypothetical protein BH23CHL8_BH23CHL8_27010 [soil metagenome]